MLKNSLIILLFILLISCEGKKETKSDDVYYTCSMDPQVVESKPGTCPICKMPLTEVKKGQSQNKDELELSEQQIQLGNIKIDTLREHTLGEDMLLTGLAMPNQNKLTIVSSRVMGRIEKLYFKTTGEVIFKGQPLYEIYSEELNTTIRELLTTIEKKKTLKYNSDVDWDKIIQDSRNKLSLYGLSDEQIDKIEKENTELNTVTVFNKSDGVIYAVDAKEGSYVAEGGTIYQIADFSTVWIEAEVYSNYLKEIKEGMEAKITFPGIPEKQFSGQVTFVNPQLNSSSKINLLRIEIDNKEGEIRPGMQAYINLLLKEKAVLSLPFQAVIRDSKGSSVWVKTSANKFKYVMVQSGIDANGYTEIVSGLKKGDVAIVSGAYLVSSEYVFKKGSTPMEGHHH